MNTPRRLSGLRSGDIIATVAVALATAAFWLFRAGNPVPGLGSTRAVAAVTLGLGLVACGVGGQGNPCEGKGVTRVILAIQSVLGGAALVVGILAIALGSDPLLTTLITMTLTLWASATLRHLLIPRAPSTVNAGPQREMPRSDEFAATNR